MTHLIRAFWHKPRKSFVPMTVNDIVQKEGVGRNEVICALRRLSEAKAVFPTQTTNKMLPTIWELTEEGQRMATRMMQQQERLKA